MIAKAVLVTTKGGRSTIHIKFSKTVAARLSKAHNVPLMLRLVVRNAASGAPQTASVLSAVTLNAVTAPAQGGGSFSPRRRRALALNTKYHRHPSST